MKRFALLVASALLTGCSSPGSYEWFRATPQTEIYEFYGQQCTAAGYKSGTRTFDQCTQDAMRQGWKDAKAANAS